MTNKLKIFEDKDTIMTVNNNSQYELHRKMDMNQHNALAQKIHTDKDNDRWNRSQSMGNLVDEHAPVGMLLPAFFEEWVLETLGVMPTENGKPMNTVRIIATRPDLVAAYFQSEKGKIFCRNPQYVKQITK